MDDKGQQYDIEVLDSNRGVFRPGDRPQYPLHDIRPIRIITLLSAIAEQGERLSSQNETGELVHREIGPLSRPNDGEESECGTPEIPDEDEINFYAQFSDHLIINSKYGSFL